MKKLDEGRCVLFLIDAYDPAGGWGDAAARGSKERLLAYAATSRTPQFLSGRYQIVDSDTMEVVAEGSLEDFCKHINRYRVAEPSRSDGIIASGMSAMPGLYCSDCGKRMGP